MKDTQIFENVIEIDWELVRATVQGSHGALVLFDFTAHFPASITNTCGKHSGPGERSGTGSAQPMGAEYEPGQPIRAQGCDAAAALSGGQVSFYQRRVLPSSIGQMLPRLTCH